MRRFAGELMSGMEILGGHTRLYVEYNLLCHEALVEMVLGYAHLGEHHRRRVDAMEAEASAQHDTRVEVRVSRAPRRY